MLSQGKLACASHGFWFAYSAAQFSVQSGSQISVRNTATSKEDVKSSLPQDFAQGRIEVVNASALDHEFFTHVPPSLPFLVSLILWCSPNACSTVANRQMARPSMLPARLFQLHWGTPDSLPWCILPGTIHSAWQQEASDVSQSSVETSVAPFHVQPMRLANRVHDYFQASNHETKQANLQRRQMRKSTVCLDNQMSSVSLDSTTFKRKELVSICA